MRLKTVLEELKYSLYWILLVLYSCELDEGLPSLIHALRHSGWVKLKANIFFFFSTKPNMRKTGERIRWALPPSIQQAWSTEVRWFSHFFCFSFLLNGIHLGWIENYNHVSEEGFPLPVECIFLHFTCTCKCILDMPCWVEALLLAV